MTRVLLTHAYSYSNAGDGLLVDESVKVLSASGVRANDIRVAAIEPETFERFNVLAAPTASTRGLAARIAGGASSILRHHRGLAEAIEWADAVVAVGGGYLRGRQPREIMTAFLSHYGQLRTSVASRPVILLPQSIGPFNSATGRLYRNELAKARLVCVRDDVSYGDLQHLPNVQRFSDLVVYAIAGSASKAVTPDGSVAVIARRLHRAPHYVERLRKLQEALPATKFVVQSSTGISNDDRQFYNSIGASPSVPASLYFKEAKGVVVSVRLHGALEAIRRGLPAIHLSYERKGPSAFKDLGIPEYVHSARDFAPDVIAKQVQDLSANPAGYWKAIDERRGQLIAEYAKLVTRVSDCLH